MRYRSVAIGLALLAAAVIGRKDVSIGAPVSTVVAPKGFTSLFNGHDLSGWHGLQGDFDPYKLAAMDAETRSKKLAEWDADAKKHWSVKGGELVNDGHGAFLTTDKDYADIELLVDFKIQPKGDSGVYLRATPQVQIWDFNESAGYWKHGADKGSGGLWNNSPGAAGKDPMVRADNPVGQWNSLRIIQVGERTTVYLNDKLVVDHARLENYWNHSLPLRRKGPVQLQTHGGLLHWRNLFIREIPSTEANEILKKHGADGFVSVFNGKDFSGWAGPVDQYEVKDGAIVCRPHKGGNVYTQEIYSDFVARVEYRLPPGGNNGLGIRYPGEGDGAYEGMCEVQILDDSAPQYAKLDPRQYNGSAYGMTAVHRGYLRPVGEWNFIEVTVIGSTVRCELNGTRVLDTDLSKVTDYMANHPHPGKDRSSGHFGFLGHNDPVAFRTVEIKRLDKK
jgi:hypothetical protein